jgi:hypothetical protein
MKREVGGVGEGVYEGWGKGCDDRLKEGVCTAATKTTTVDDDDDETAQKPRNH